MSALRVTMLAPFGIRPKGTLSARMLPLAQALVRRGHAVSIIAPPVQNPQDAGRRAVYAGVPVTHTPLPSWPGAAGVAQQVQSLLRAALAERPDLVHLFKPKGYSGLAALLLRALRPNLPLLVDTDDWEGWGGWNELLPYPRAAKMLFAWQERDLPRRAAGQPIIIGTSAAIRSRTSNSQKRVYNSIEHCVPFCGGFSMLNCSFSIPITPFGRYITRSGGTPKPQTCACKVRLATVTVAARLLVVGRGERGEERELLRLAARAGIAAAIDYRGWVEPHAIPALLASADIALVPIDDTLINRARSSAKLLELMAAGLPIVAGRVGEVAEYIEDRRSGLLVAPGDPAALARATLMLLADPMLRTRLGRAAQERAAQHFGWDRLALQAEAAYMRALQDVQRGSPGR